MANYDVSYIFKVVDKFSPAVKEMSKKLDDLQNGLDKIQKKAESTSFKFKQLGESMASMGRSLSLRVTAPLIAAATYAIKNAENFHEMTMSIQAFTGSAEKAAKVMDIVRKTSMEMPLAPEALANASRLLLSYGISVDDLSAKLKQMSILSMGSGINIDELTQTLGRFEVRGFANSRMLASLSAKGLPLIQTIKDMAKAAGMSDAAIQKMVTKGNIGWGIIQQALDKLTTKGSPFFDVAIEKSKDFDARLIEIHNTVRIITARLGESVSAILGLDVVSGQLLNKLQGIANTLPAWIETHKTLIKIGLAIAGIGAALGPILWIFGNILKIIALISSPIVIAIAAVAALGYGLYRLYKASALLRDALKIAFLPIEIAVKATEKLVHLFERLWHSIPGRTALGNVGGMMMGQYGLGTMMAQGMGTKSTLSPVQNAPTMTHNVNSTLDINVNAPKGILQSIITGGGSKFNLGQNMAFAR